MCLCLVQIGLKTSVGLTPLHNAASNGHVRALETLICAGAAVNARAGSNATALFIAAQNGHVEVRLKQIHHPSYSSAELCLIESGAYAIPQSQCVSNAAHCLLC